MKKNLAIQKILGLLLVVVTLIAMFAIGEGDATWAAFTCMMGLFMLFTNKNYLG